METIVQAVDYVNYAYVFYGTHALSRHFILMSTYQQHVLRCVGSFAMVAEGKFTGFTNF